MRNINKRKHIRKNIKRKLVKSKIASKEKSAVDIAIIVIVISLCILLKSITSYNAKFYTKDDIANFNIDIKTIVKIKKDAEDKNLKFEKLLVMYSKDNNYFAKGSYVKEYVNSKNKLIENLKFGMFVLGEEDTVIYNMVKSFNSDIKCLPIKKENYKDVVGINSFDSFTKNYSTIFIEKDNNICNIDVVSITDGVVESVLYDGENGLTVTILSPSGNKYVYANLSEAKVRVGSSVKAEKTIGVMGNSKQVKDEISFERCKLKLYAIHTVDGEEIYFNIYSLLATKN